METTLIFSTDDYPDCEISGYVESFAPNIFTQDPEIQVSIICPNPDFVAVDPVVIDGAVISTEETSYSFTEIATVGTIPTPMNITVKAAGSTEPVDPTTYLLSLKNSPSDFVGFTVNNVLVSVTDNQYLEIDSTPSNKIANQVYGFCVSSSSAS